MCLVNNCMECGVSVENGVNGYVEFMVEENHIECVCGECQREFKELEIATGAEENVFAEMWKESNEVGFVGVDGVKEEELLVLFKSAEVCISSVEASELGISDYDLHIAKQYDGDLPF